MMNYVLDERLPGEGFEYIFNHGLIHSDKKNTILCITNEGKNCSYPNMQCLSIFDAMRVFFGTKRILDEEELYDWIQKILDGDLKLKNNSLMHSFKVCIIKQTQDLRPHHVIFIMILLATVMDPNAQHILLGTSALSFKANLLVGPSDPRMMKFAAVIFASDHRWTTIEIRDLLYPKAASILNNLLYDTQLPTQPDQTDNIPKIVYTVLDFQNRASIVRLVDQSIIPFVTDNTINIHVDMKYVLELTKLKTHIRFIGYAAHVHFVDISEPIINDDITIIMGLDARTNISKLRPCVNSASNVIHIYQAAGQMIHDAFGSISDLSIRMSAEPCFNISLWDAYRPTETPSISVSTLISSMDKLAIRDIMRPVFQSAYQETPRSAGNIITMSKLKPYQKCFYGILIPSIVEYSITGRIVALDRKPWLSEPIERKYRSNNKTLMTWIEIINVLSRRKILRETSWVEPQVITQATSQLARFIRHYAANPVFEVMFSKRINNHIICGSIDMKSENCIYEFKFANRLRNIHLLQLCIYILCDDEVTQGVLYNVQTHIMIRIQKCDVASIMQCFAIRPPVLKYENDITFISRWMEIRKNHARRQFHTTSVFGIPIQ